MKANFKTFLILAVAMIVIAIATTPAWINNTSTAQTNGTTPSSVVSTTDSTMAGYIDTECTNLAATRNAAERQPMKGNKKYDGHNDAAMMPTNGSNYEDTGQGNTIATNTAKHGVDTTTRGARNAKKTDIAMMSTTLPKANQYLTE